MKTIIILFVLSISFIPLAISGGDPHIRLPTKADLTENSVVLDVEGNPVVAGAKYYAVPATIGVDGGISATQPKNGNPSACPTDVVLNSSIAGYHPIAQGRPLVFYPLSGDEAVVLESLPLNVAFYSAEQSDPCAKETVWKLDFSAEQQVVVTGGTIGDQGDITNWFRITKNIYGRGYIFTFWPSLCSHCFIRYYRIGTVGETHQLGIDEAFPFPFNFVRAE